MVKRNIDSLLLGKSAKSAYRSFCSMVLTVELVDGGGVIQHPYLLLCTKLLFMQCFILNH